MGARFPENACFYVFNGFALTRAAANTFHESERWIEKVDLGLAPWEPLS
jgi:hypothetical protein